MDFKSEQCKLKLGLGLLFKHMIYKGGLLLNSA